MSNRRAFTLIELLVVISIITLQIAILLPALTKARESGRRAACGSANRQIGIMLTAYANDYEGHLPESNPTLAPGQGIDLTFIPSLRIPLGLAILITEGYDTDPRVLYCPSWSHPSVQYDTVGEDPLGYFSSDVYGGWPAAGTETTTGLAVIGISYHYRASFYDVPAGDFHAGRLDSPDFDSETALSADHWTRREGLLGVLYGHKDAYNVLHADMHVETIRVSEEAMDEANLYAGYTNQNWFLQENVWELVFGDGELTP